MEVEVGYFPKRYYDSDPDAGGYFPFAVEGTTPYVLSLEGFSLPQVAERFLPMWLLNIHAFPLYFCAEVPSYWKEEFEHKCKAFNISSESIVTNVEHSVFIAEIETKKQFRQIFPFYITLGSGNDLVVWSNIKDAFRVEPRKWRGNWEGKIAETVVAKLEADTSIFWIGYDGDSITVISNQSNFSTYEKVIKTFPEFVVPKPIEFA